MDSDTERRKRTKWNVVRSLLSLFSGVGFTLVWMENHHWLRLIAAVGFLTNSMLFAHMALSERTKADS